MSTLTLSPVNRKSSIKVRPYRRCVRRVERVGDVVHFRSYSFGRAGRDVEHKLEINVRLGDVTCGCEHFQFRLKKLRPTVHSPREHICHHIERAINNCLRHGDLSPQHEPVLHRCATCDAIGAEFDMCDEQGVVIPNSFICLTCVDARMDNLQDAEPAVEEHHPAPTSAAVPPAKVDWRSMTREEREELFNSF